MMEKNRQKTKLTIVGFVLFLFAIAFLGVFSSRNAEFQVQELQERTAPKVLDSVIEEKVSMRFTSYDAEFLLNNLIVVNDKGKIIGKVLIYTNINELDSFYNINPDFVKTRTYENILQALIKQNDSIGESYRQLVEGKPGIINTKRKE